MRDGEIAMAATAAPAETSALLRVMEEKVCVIFGYLRLLR
ncbi:hypothetical protein FHT77_006250 [Rhizobium sp. BK181]|nr:hypothetical protein [Rhizobium sp. BK181]